MINAIFNNFFSKNIDRDNLEKINNAVHIFNVHLFNGTSKVGLKFSAIDDLVIIDDLRYFYNYGYLTFSYNNEPIESFESLGNTEPGNTQKVFQPYVFRGDGRDLLMVEIMPQLKDNECLEISSTESEKRRYCIKHTFSVYKMEDKTDGKGAKRRTLYFWDRDYQLLKNVNIDFSTQELIKKQQRETIRVNSGDVDVSSSSYNNSVPTGDAIKGILNKALKENYKISVKYGRWDEGGGTINYNSPSQATALDDLENLTTFHVATDEDYNLPCLLKKERYTDKYELIPINKFYDSGLVRGQSIINSLFGGAKFTEDFFIGKADPGSTDIFASSFKSPLQGGNKQNISDFNFIDNYKFTKISAEDLQEYFTSYAVHTTDPRGSFRTDLKNNNYESVKKMYDKVFVNTMPGTTKGGKGKSNLPDNIIRETHKSPRHIFFPGLLQEKERKVFGINKSMLNLFFKNSNITFKVRGTTIRKAGNFFSINRRDSAIQESHDNNLLGQYLSIYVRHEFKSGTYNNVLVGIKPYAAQDPKFAKAM